MDDKNVAFTNIKRRPDLFYWKSENRRMRERYTTLKNGRRNNTAINRGKICGPADFSMVIAVYFRNRGNR